MPLLTKSPVVLANYMMSLPEELAYSTGMDCYQIRCTRSERGWLTVLKAQHRGKYLVAFVSGTSYADSMSRAAAAVYDGTARWQGDRYPPKTPVG